MTRIFHHMHKFVHTLPHGERVPSPLDVDFIFGGYSWREKDFRFWKLRAIGQGFLSKLRLASLLKDKSKLPEGGFDMEPFEVLRDIIRSGRYPSIGGPPQLVKVYEHMNTLPFALYWPNRASGKVAALGRPLMDYEVSSWPVLDPDDIRFRPDDDAI